ncbi:MAG: hypothetical protein M3454_18165, partial [Actinomycetota bacterium]|nr:hypothetical protein [Actinomycetota bacterium]
MAQPEGGSSSGRDWGRRSAALSSAFIRAAPSAAGSRPSKPRLVPPCSHHQRRKRARSAVRTS